MNNNNEKKKRMRILVYAYEKKSKFIKFNIYEWREEKWNRLDNDRIGSQTFHVRPPYLHNHHLKALAKQLMQKLFSSHLFRSLFVPLAVAQCSFCKVKRELLNSLVNFDSTKQYYAFDGCCCVYVYVQEKRARSKNGHSFDPKL